ncbi:GyrI-like domain-containing protein [Tissierella praeacuta]|uniref:GyrI-like domain-containing protein n=1 Tax=Tissierella praeacuta TaxID=43131 RepID=UPI003340108F
MTHHHWSGVYGLELSDERKKKLFGHEVNSTNYVPENIEIYRLESSLYAIFRTLGPITESAQKTWDYIYSVWLIESEYEHAGIHDIEYYYFNQGELTTDLYVPVVSKNIK